MFILTPLIIAIIVILAGVFLFFKWRFKLASSNEAIIITGTRLGDPAKDSRIYKDDEGRYMKVVRGGGHRLKMFQKATRVDLQAFQLHIKTPKVYTKQGVGLYGEAVATIKIADTLEGVVRYAEQFLGKKDKEVHEEIANVLSSNLRAILSKLTIEETNEDRESFNNQVTSIAQNQLDRMGFFITSFGLTDIYDDDEYLENLGKPQTAEVKKKADIAEAENKRETEIKQAEVNEDVEREKYQREMNIADSKKEKDIKESRILAETQREKAIADASYNMEKEDRQLEVEKRRLDIREQERETDLRIKRMERENDVTLEEKQVEVRKQQVEADYLVQVREAEALSESKIQEGRADAQVTRDKSAAEVEALRNRSQAMDKYREVVLMEKMMEMMPEFARAVSESISNVESIRILDSGDGEQVKSLPQTVTGMVSNLQESLGQMTGFDMESVLSKLSNSKEGKDILDHVTKDTKEDPAEEASVPANRTEASKDTNETNDEKSDQEEDKAQDEKVRDEKNARTADEQQTSDSGQTEPDETTETNEDHQEETESSAAASTWDDFKDDVKDDVKDKVKERVEEEMGDNLENLSPLEYYEKFGEIRDRDV